MRTFCRARRSAVVNAQSRVIFNCSFESSKSAKIEELFVENGLCGTRISALTMSVLTMIEPYGAYTVY
jgi:hypothetical protein